MPLQLLHFFTRTVGFLEDSVQDALQQQTPRRSLDAEAPVSGIPFLGSRGYQYPESLS